MNTWASAVNPSYPKAAAAAGMPPKTAPPITTPEAAPLKKQSGFSKQPFGSRNGPVILSLKRDPFNLKANY